LARTALPAGPPPIMQVVKGKEELPGEPSAGAGRIGLILWVGVVIWREVEVQVQVKEK